MIILFSVRKRTAILLIIAFLISCGLGIYIHSLFKTKTTTNMDDIAKEMLGVQIQQMFDIRNKALLERDTEKLETLYDREVKLGQWAYEHELKKMNYLYKWSAKQGVNFKTINSKVITRWVKEKGSGYTVNLLVSTEYEYLYNDTQEIINSSRIGTYHSLDIVPRDDGWVIIKEWYADPFADSLHLGDIKNQEVKELILSRKSKDSLNLNERRKKALEYMNRYCGAASLPEYGFQYNPKYTNYNHLGGDCANFTSQMLYEGAGFRKNGTWNYENGSGSRAWVNAHAFNQYMIYSGRASLLARGTYSQILKHSYKLLPGDYIAYQKKGKVKHVSIVSGIDSKGYILVNSHNSDRYRVPWDLGWSNKGIKFWLVRVHF